MHNTVTLTRTSRKGGALAAERQTTRHYNPSMTTEMWIIAAVRVAGSLPVLRWPLAGAFIAIFVDLSDLFLRDWIDLGGVKDYQRFDKSLDQVYMLTFLLVALRWQAVPRNIAIALYAFRLVGSIAFEVTGARAVLILFPNAFEYWFIFVAALKHFGWEEPARRAQASPPTTFGESYSQSAFGTRIDGAAQAQSRIVLERQPDLTQRTSSWPVIGPITRFVIPFRYSSAQLLVALSVTIAAKMFHEYMLHVGQWFEGFTATEALDAVWRFLTPPY